MRGEHSGFVANFPYNEGSSPHARGALYQADAENEHRGIIPACAGSTPSRGTTLADPRDHPRMRGEHL